MVDSHRRLRVNAVELLRQPGTVRRIELTVPAATSEVLHPALNGDIDIDVTLETSNSGITVRGKLLVPWTGECRRGLVPLGGVATVEVGELYQIDPIDPDAFPIEGGQLDLQPMVRELALLALDDERLCKEPCIGVCPTLRIESGVTIEAPTARDDRWSALDDVLLDDD